MRMTHFGLGMSLTALVTWVAAAASCTNEPFATATTSSTSTTTTSSTTTTPVSCTDGVLGDGETDVDCGGPCDPCDDGETCAVADDCASRLCETVGAGGSGGAAGAATGGAGGGSFGVCAACTGSEACGEGLYCSSGACLARQEVGAACASADACLSGFCPSQDGVCCETACDGACEACAQGKTGLASGTCGAVTEGADPDSECIDAGTASCGVSGQGCNGETAAPGCKLYGPGVACAPAGCTDGAAFDVATCDGVGHCIDATSAPCAPYVCDPLGLACLSTCATSADCAATHYCNASGSCVARKSDGDGCTAAEQCASGFCPTADGVCCDTACGGGCQACLASKTGGSNGTCSFVTSGTDPDSECSNVLAPNCNGAGQCGL